MKIDLRQVRRLIFVNWADCSDTYWTNAVLASGETEWAGRPRTNHAYEIFLRSDTSRPRRPIARLQFPAKMAER